VDALAGSEDRSNKLTAGAGLDTFGLGKIFTTAGSEKLIFGYPLGTIRIQISLCQPAVGIYNVRPDHGN
jgi:hypothetical protein